MDDMDARENETLANIQSAYFEFLDKQFGHFYSQMRREGLTPYQMGVRAGSSDKFVKAVSEIAEEVHKGLWEFWDDYEPAMRKHLSQSSTLKGVFGGDVFPSYTKNVASSAGLYLDTIVLPDPVLKTLSSHHLARPEFSAYLLMKHALNALSYRELALADVDTPIVVIAPGHTREFANLPAQIRMAGEADTLAHASRLFGRKIRSRKSLEKHLSRFETPDELIASLKEPERLLFDTEWTDDLATQFQRYVSESLGQFETDLGQEQPGVILHTFLMGRMLQVNAAVQDSLDYQGSPLITAPTSWQYLQWKYEYDLERGREVFPDRHQSMVVSALSQSDGEPFALLSSVPPSTLIELRRRDALRSLRETIRAGVDDIATADRTDFEEVVAMVRGNLQTALDDHQKQLADASSSRLFYGMDVASFIGRGALGVIGATTDNVLATLGALGITLAASTNVKDLWRKGRELLDKETTVRRSPVAILVRHLDVDKPTSFTDAIL